MGLDWVVDSGTGFGACAGARNVLGDVVDRPLGAELVRCPGTRCLGPVAWPAWTVLPGRAWAATSVSTPVRVTLPAISQRLTRMSLRSAVSRAFVVRVRGI